jgi:lysophospholipase L1-like esterase
MEAAQRNNKGKRTPRWIALPLKALGGCVVALLVSELFLQVLGIFVSSSDRMKAPEEGSISILCVGDSHTFGLDVLAPFNYPNRLHAFLNEGRDRDHYRVISRGVPGRNSAVVREKLPLYLEQFRPHLVLILCGYNNTWNPEGAWFWEGQEEGAFHLESLLSRLKLYKLIRLYLLNRGEPPPTGEFRITSDGERFMVLENGKEKPIHPGEGSAPGLRRGAELKRVTEMDLAACVQLCREKEAIPVLLTYALAGGDFAPVNEAARAVAEKTGAPLIDQEALFKKHLVVEDPETLYFADHLHLKRSGYELAARDIARVLVEEGWVEQPPGPGGERNDRPKPDPKNLNLSLRIEDQGPGQAPLILVSGSEGVTYQILLSAQRTSGDTENTKDPWTGLGIALDELVSLSKTTPSFSGTFSGAITRLPIPLSLWESRAGQTVYGCLLALDRHALEMNSMLLGWVGPVSITFPSLRSEKE